MANPNEATIIENIIKALEITLSEQNITAKDLPEITPEINLLDDDILNDSLDSIVFFMELSEIAGKEFPEGDLMAEGYYSVQRIIDFLSE